MVATTNPMTTDWKRRHEEAFSHPRGGFEPALVDLYNGLQQYAEAYHDRFESEIGDDGVLGPEWVAIARGIIGLLNGDTGRLDAGTLDKWIRELATNANVEEEL